MWQEIGLLGRDRLLAKEILPRIRGKGRFYLTGQRGIGKTAVLKWAYQHSPEPKAYVSTKLSPRELIIELCLGLQINPELLDSEISIERKLNRMTRQSLEKLLVQSNVKGNIFIDDIEGVKPTTIKILAYLSTKHQLFFAGVPPFRDEIRKYLWGAVEIPLRRLERNDVVRMSLKLSEKVGKVINVDQVVNASDGVPGKVVQMIFGEVEWKRPIRMKEEEINIAPVLLIGVSIVVILRYVSIGIDAVDLYLLSGFGMGIAVFLRYLVYNMMRRR